LTERDTAREGTQQRECEGERRVSR